MTSNFVLLNIEHNYLLSEFHPCTPGIYFCQMWRGKIRVAIWFQIKVKKVCEIDSGNIIARKYVAYSQRKNKFLGLGL